MWMSSTASSRSSSPEMLRPGARRPRACSHGRYPARTAVRPSTRRSISAQDQRATSKTVRSVASRSNSCSKSQKTGRSPTSRRAAAIEGRLGAPVPRRALQPAAENPGRQQDQRPQQPEHALHRDSDESKRQGQQPDEWPQEQRQQGQGPAKEEKDEPEEYRRHGYTVTPALSCRQDNCPPTATCTGFPARRVLPPFLRGRARHNGPVPGPDGAAESANQPQNLAGGSNEPLAGHWHSGARIV